MTWHLILLPGTNEIIDLTGNPHGFDHRIELSSIKAPLCGCYDLGVLRYRKDTCSYEIPMIRYRGIITPE